MKSKYGFSYKVNSNYPDPKILLEKDCDFSKDSARKDLLAHMGIPKGKCRILDIGCATGKTLEQAGKLVPHAELYGVEPDPRLSEQAGRYGKVFTGSIEEFLKTNKLAFDYVLMGDVIEHLIDPWVTLKEIKKIIKPEGYLLASIPNVQNIMVVLNLLNGRFPYASNDIINKWHLRFFTLYEIVEMLMVCGFKEYSFEANMIDMNDGLREIIKKIKTIVNLPDYQHFEVYQFIIKAR